MFAFIFLCYIISTVHSCAPTVPVSTTTISPNITSTVSPTTTTVSSSTSNISTTTTSLDSTTTTIRNCCEWPFPSRAVNTVEPLDDFWNQCDQPITFSCSISNETTVLSPSHGIAVDIDINSRVYSQISLAQVTSISQELTITTNITCNTTSHLWVVNGGARQGSSFACAYRLASNQTAWFWGSDSTDV